MSKSCTRMNLKKEFKMTKREKILTIILAGILVGYGYYQVAYGELEHVNWIGGTFQRHER